MDKNLSTFLIKNLIFFYTQKYPWKSLGNPGALLKEKMKEGNHYIID